MPFERIEQLDTGWGWAAVDFLPSMSSKPSSIALDRFSNPENLGRDWRSLTRDLPAPSALPRRFRYLPLTPGPNGFEEAFAAHPQPPKRAAAVCKICGTIHVLHAGGQPGGGLEELRQAWSPRLYFFVLPSWVSLCHLFYDALAGPSLEMLGYVCSDF